MKTTKNDPRLTMRAVADLIPYARNSRTHSPAQVAKIAASIREFGFTNPVLIQGDGTIIAGHGRVMAAQQLGLSEVPTIALDYLTPAQVRAYVIADNRLALDAGWDEAMLKVELAELSEDGFDLALTGFNDAELGKLLSVPDLEVLDPGEGEDKGTAPPLLTWAKRKVPMNAAELEALNRAFRDHELAVGTSYGFVAKLLGMGGGNGA